MGRRRRGPSWDGILIVDKPHGPTSHDVVQTVRRAAGQSRVGHTGTLDPAATGVLVVCLGRATKLVQFLQAGTKTYRARLVLGVETTSQDAQGDVVATRDASGVDEARLRAVLGELTGRIEQIPPMVSAVKVEGRRLHEAARAGEEVEREPRQVTVHGLELLEFEPGERAEAEVEVSCSAGTYVRTLAHDAGRALGVGASLLTLRRTANGPFTDLEAHSLDDVVAAGERRALAGLTLPPLEAVRRCLPVVEIAEEELARRLVQGGGLPAQGHAEPYAVVHAGLLVGVYADEDERARPQLVWTRPEELAAAGHVGEDAPAMRDQAPSASTRGQEP
jgi:tRNA pseudouridine55 synthase